MPYKRTYKKRTYKKRTYKRRDVATKSFVKKELHKSIETKYNDEQFSANVDWNGSITGITSAIAQGVTDTTRVGDKLRIRKIRIEGHITCADATNLVRIIVFQWKQNTALVTPITSYVVQYTGTTAAPMSPMNYDYQGGTYVVLYTRVFKLVLGTSSEMVKFKFTVPMKYCKKLVEYNAGGTTATNHVYMMAISDSGVATHPPVFMFSRIFYEDA